MSAIDPHRISGLAATKAQLLVESGGQIDGVIVRKGDRLMIVTNAGRVESYIANEQGAIALAQSMRERDELDRVVKQYWDERHKAEGQ